MASAAIKKIIIIPIFAAVVASQYAYDRSKLEALQIQFPAPLQLIRVFDLGLHSAAASLLWIETIVQLSFFQRGTEPFFNNFRTINDLDPKFSFPYAFTVLVLPTSRAYPDKIAAAIEIGKRGIAEADPDWRIPFYLAAVHLLELKDHENAVKYFDIASQTVGAPHYIKRFSSTFVWAKTFREQTREFWRAVYENAEDERSEEHTSELQSQFHLV